MGLNVVFLRKGLCTVLNFFIFLSFLPNVHKLVGRVALFTGKNEETTKILYNKMVEL